MIFVFGSNTQGRHGAGSALYAYKKLGAKLGVGEGLTGGSYALPTVGHNISRMDFTTVKHHVGIFIEFAANNPELEFQVTCVGCGLAGFTNEQIAPLFISSPSNCLFDTAWKQFLPKARFWGTF